MSPPQRRGVCASLACTLSLSLVLLSAPLPAAAQATIIQGLTLREFVNGPFAGRDGALALYLFPGSPYPFNNLGAGFDVLSVCAPGQDPSLGGLWLSAGRGFGDMVAHTPNGSPFAAGSVDPSNQTALCNELDTDDTWWFAYGNSLNLSPLLTGRFFGQDDQLQAPSCSVIQQPEEGLIFLERRSKDRQLPDLSCQHRDPSYPLRIGTLLICSFTNTWLDAAGQNIQPFLEDCQRYLACSNTTLGETINRGNGCGQPTPGQAVPTPTNPPVVQCSTQQLAGFDTPETRQVELAKQSGTFRFDYDTRNLQDQIIVKYEGKTLFDSGCVGAAATVNLSYVGNTSRVSVEVIPNCAGGGGTAWSWVTHCP